MVDWPTGLAGFAAGLLISIFTAPVGVSGAVFLLPVQLSVLHVPSPAVTPTNLLYDVAVGTVGGIYGIGGGSLLGPILAGRGTPMSTIAPAALACTFVTSAAGAATYGLLALTTTGAIAPHWTLGLLCGAGGLIGGYLGARLQPRLPERALRLLLGALATTYLVQSVT